eukprot:8309530-Ditylum_brightwellii.AAC.1
MLFGNSVPVFVDMGSGVNPGVDKLIMKLTKQVALYGGTKTAEHSAGILDYIGEQFEKAKKACSMIHEGAVQFDDEKRSNQEQSHLMR